VIDDQTHATHACDGCGWRRQFVTPEMLGRRVPDMYCRRCSRFCTFAPLDYAGNPTTTPPQETTMTTTQPSTAFERTENSYIQYDDPTKPNWFHPAARPDDAIRLTITTLLGDIEMINEALDHAARTTGVCSDYERELKSWNACYAGGCVVLRGRAEMRDGQRVTFDWVGSDKLTYDDMDVELGNDNIANLAIEYTPRTWPWREAWEGAAQQRDDLRDRARSAARMLRAIRYELTERTNHLGQARFREIALEWLRENRSLNYPWFPKATSHRITIEVSTMGEMPSAATVRSSIERVIREPNENSILPPGTSVDEVSVTHFGDDGEPVRS
jgi:hypothetical protein